LSNVALAVAVLSLTGCEPNGSRDAVQLAETPFSAILPGVDDAVQHALRRGKPTVAEFGSTICVGCREMKAVLAALRAEHGSDLTIVDIDLIRQKSEGYMQRYRIQVMPTQIFYDAQGRELSRHMGAITAPEILARLGVGASADGATR